MTKRIRHWIGGEPLAGDSPRTGEVFDPATGEVTSHVDFADAQQVDLAVGAARKAFEEWRSSSLTKRAAVLFAFRELVNVHQDDLAAIVTAEHGKVLSDAKGEVS